MPQRTQNVLQNAPIWCEKSARKMLNVSSLHAFFVGETPTRFSDKLRFCRLSRLAKLFIVRELLVNRLYLLLVILLPGIAGAQAAELYVSTQGNDSDSGNSTSPLRTITRAYALATAGTTIIVLPGVYTDYSSGWGIHLGKSGTASNPIVLKSQVRGQAIVDGQNASDRNQGFYIDGDYNVVDGFEIRNSPHGGFAMYGNNNRIINNEIHHNGNPPSTSTNGRDGIYSDKGTSGNYYAANSIHDNGRPGSNLDHGLYLCGENESVINNLLFRNAATGLQVAGYDTVSNIKVYNNVIAWNGTSGIILWMSLDGVDIRNNIIYANGRYGLNSYEGHGSGVIVDHNLCFANPAGSYNFTAGGSDYSYTLGTTLSIEPLFLNGTLAGFDPHLRDNSPAIKNGVNLSSVFTTDLDGATRSATEAWDLGGYHFGNNPGGPIGPLGALQMSIQNGTVHLRWPTNLGDYVLQSKPMTSLTAAWQDMIVTPAQEQGENVVSYSTSEPGRLFRLWPR